MLPCGTIFHINDVLYSVKSKRNLLSFKNICHNGYHIETTYDNNKEYLCITHIVSSQKLVVEKLSAFSSGLYYTTITTIELNMVMSQKISHPDIFMLLHDRLGHPGSTMMRRIIENLYGHPLKNHKIILSSDYPCTACSQGILIVRPSHTKVLVESQTFLERIQGDMWTNFPPCGPFRYFMVLIDASSQWSHVCLLSTRNVAFAKLLTQIIRLQAHFPDYSIKKIRLDNAGEFISKAFDDYCMSVGIEVEHLIAHVHTQNGLAEAFI